MSRAFSLVELSIVLVILGLLTGGILAGQSLIRAAELRSVSTEYNRYLAATQTFRDKYFAAPGDMNNATKFWGDNASACADAAVTDGTPGTCNGNGNGQVVYGAAANGTGEGFQFWNQLALAGLVEGSYSGLAGPNNSSDVMLGTNSPRSRLGSAGWSVSYWGNYAGAVSQNFAGDYGNYLLFGIDTASVNDAQAIRADEAWNIDTKLDDGKPATGKVVAKWHSTCTNATGVSDTASDYLLSSPSATACGLFFPRVL